jgi:hypothetical protein
MIYENEDVHLFFMSILIVLALVSANLTWPGKAASGVPKHPLAD